MSSATPLQDPSGLAYVTTEDTCSKCGAKLRNAETSRSYWQGEAHRLDGELKACRSDSERLDWLEAQGGDDQWVVHREVAGPRVVAFSTRGNNWVNQKPTLREAIDAAMTPSGVANFGLNEPNQQQRKTYGES